MHSSLSATFLRNRIINALRKSPDSAISNLAGTISQNFVFDQPTIQQLASSIFASITPASSAQPERSRLQQIGELINQYTAGIPDRSATRARVVLLTGSTGSIGSHILVTLLRDEAISKVYTFDRHTKDVTIQQRLANSLRERGLPVELLSSAKLTALTGDLNADFFGLDRPTYYEVSSCQ